MAPPHNYFKKPKQPKKQPLSRSRTSSISKRKRENDETEDNEAKRNATQTAAMTRANYYPNTAQTSEHTNRDYDITETKNTKPKSDAAQSTIEIKAGLIGKISYSPNTAQVPKHSNQEDETASITSNVSNDSNKSRRGRPRKNIEKNSLTKT